MPLHLIKMPESGSDRRVVLGVSDRTLLPLLRERYADVVRLRLKSIMGRDLRVEFRPARMPEDAPTFELFLEGRSNAVALRAARSVVANPGQDGPLFLYGPRGVGKSHLAAAIQQAASAHGLAVLCLGADAVTKQGGVPDLLILDRHTDGERSWPDRVVLLITECHKRGAQIVATGRSPLSAIKMPAVCRDILGAGIQVRIEPPEAELRARFLEREFQGSPLDVPDGFLHDLLEILSPDFSQLRAAARKLRFLGTNGSLPTDVAALRKQLGEFLPGARKSGTGFITPESILGAVAEAFDVSPADILGTSRRARLTLPRHLAMQLAVDLTELNKSAVARFFRRNDHSTVINAEKNIRRRLERDEEFGRTVTELRQILLARRNPEAPGVL